MSRLHLSPEWDRWFDEEFTDLVVSDPEWVRAEFASLIHRSTRSDSAPGHQPSGERRSDELDTP
jgi:hypothetical protein